MLDQEACQGPAKPSARTTAGGSAGATNANRVCHEQHGGTGGEVDMEQSASLPAGAGATAAAPLSGRSRPARNEAERLRPFSWDGYARSTGLFRLAAHTSCIGSSCAIMSLTRPV